METQIELLVPNSWTDQDVAAWCLERGYYFWHTFNPRPNYPSGICDTKWESIIWSYRICNVLQPNE